MLSWLRSQPPGGRDRKALPASAPTVGTAEAYLSWGAMFRDHGDWEKAASSYEAALAILYGLAETKPGEYRPELAATTLGDLGVTNSKLHRPERATQCYGLALAIFRKLAETNPKEHLENVAHTLINLGAVQLDLNDPRAASASYEEVLAIFGQMEEMEIQVNLRQVAAVRNNLGHVHSRLNNLEAALENCMAALAICHQLQEANPDEEFRPQIAAALNNLGNAQTDISRPESALESSEKAVAIYRELAKNASEEFRRLLAEVLNNLGNSQLTTGKSKAAEESHREALSIFDELAKTRPEVYQPNVAQSLLNLSNTQKGLGNFGAALESCKESLRIRRDLAKTKPELHLQSVARALNNLGNAQSALGHLEAAQASLKEATEIHDLEEGDIGIIERQRAHRNLAQLMRREAGRPGWPDYRAAHHHLGIACRLMERFRGKFRNEQERHRVLAEAAGTFDLHLRNCVDLWERTCRDGAPDTAVLAQAIWAAEASRSRQLLDRLSFTHLTPERVTPEIERALRELDARRERLLQDLNDETGADESGPGESDGNGLRMGGAKAREQAEAEAARLREIDEIDAAKADLIARLRQGDHDALPELAVVAQDFAHVRAVIPSDMPTAFVAFAVGPEASFAFVALADGTVRPVKLPALRGDDADDLAQAWFEGYTVAKRAEAANKDKQQGFGEFLRLWAATQAEVLTKVQSAALAPVLEELACLRQSGAEIHRLVISPHRALHIFPLHACRLADGRLFGEAYEISYTPSFSMLHECMERQRAGERSLLLLEDPTRSKRGRQLPFTEAESATVRRRLAAAYAPNHLPDTQATRNALIAGSFEARVIHYSGHAGFDGREPLQSELELNGRPLALGEVFAEVILRNNALTVLNGCETGFLQPDVIDDYHSFTTGFLFAGAPCVVTTLWAVPDLTSALVMDEFYAQWTKGAVPAAALQAAQNAVRELRRGAGVDGAVDRLTTGLSREVRDARRQDAARYVEEICGGAERPFADPVHWAAFTCNGLGFRRLE